MLFGVMPVMVCFSRKIEKVRNAPSSSELTGGDYQVVEYPADMSSDYRVRTIFTILHILRQNPSSTPYRPLNLGNLLRHCVKRH
jgi:hypothetical protein